MSFSSPPNNPNSSPGSPLAGLMKLMSVEKEGHPGNPDQSLSCPLCHHHLKNPRVLPSCLHSFCLTCLQKHVGKSSHFFCPVCQQQVRLEENGCLDNLPLNTYFSGLLDLADGSEAQTESDFRKASSGFVSLPFPGNETSLSKKSQMSITRPPPLRQPFFGDDGEKKILPESTPPAVAPFLPGWPSSSSTSKASQPWPTQFTFPKSSATTAPGLLTTDNQWQQMVNDSSAIVEGESLKSPYSSAIAPSPITSFSSTWSSVVGSNKPTASGPPGFSKASRPVTSSSCSCEDRHPVTSHCRDCNEDLCDSCVDAHQRVSLTRHHKIVRYPENPPMPLANPSFGMITGLKSLSTPLFGFPSDSDVMKVYADAVEKAKADCDKLVMKAKQGCVQIEDAKLQVSEMESRVEKKYAAIYNEIKVLTENYITELQNRSKALLARLDTVHNVKMSTLALQKRELSSTSSCLAQVANQLSTCSREMDLINCCNKAMNTIKEVQQKFSCGGLAVSEDDTILFEPPNPAFIKMISNFGFVGGSAYAPNSVAEGESLKKATLGKEARFVICVRDQLNETCQIAGEVVKVLIVDSEGREVQFTMSEIQTGVLKVAWQPGMEGEHVIAVTVRDRHIKESPFRLKVRKGRSYNNIGTPIFTFGSEGEHDGQLCRPWGVCCSREGFILVANRSNNRIEVFTAKGVFHHKFGVGGKQNGQFDRPTSVCCDSSNRVIVADKDNHRVQIFTINGDFILAFGEKGFKPGQFNYPWDVACNSQDQILVSDTRNHRIQLFSPSGEFLSKYGFEGAMWKYFDSPRGVCFAADDQAIVTDFNNHRLLLIKSDLYCAQFLGKEGSDAGSFIRPNGVAVDEEGNIIIADSRNDRIQIFTSSGRFIKSFGAKGIGPGEFDRPSGVCVSSDGLIIVVDFGNNRVQVF